MTIPFENIKGASWEMSQLVSDFVDQYDEFFYGLREIQHLGERFEGGCRNKFI